MPNYKIAQTSHAGAEKKKKKGRIILNYSELKFKFHFVLALSYGSKKSLGEISKGQRELKCLLYEVCQGRELEIESQRKRPSA